MNESKRVRTRRASMFLSESVGASDYRPTESVRSGRGRRGEEQRLTNEQELRSPACFLVTAAQLAHLSEKLNSYQRETVLAGRGASFASACNREFASYHY